MKSSTIEVPAQVEVEATGCLGADSYREFARKKGFKHVEVVDWTSSAGDWSFIVSKNGKTWLVLSQTNNYPRPGFSHEVGVVEYVGTAEEVIKELWAECQ